MKTEYCNVFKNVEQRIIPEILSEDCRMSHVFLLSHTYLVHGPDSFLRSWPVLSQSRNSPHFMEPEGSLPHSHVPATYPYPEPARSSPCPTSHFLKIHLNIIFPSKPGLSLLRENYRGINPYKTTILSTLLRDFKGGRGGGKQKISKYLARDRSPNLQIQHSRGWGQ
jgi:hypothetical protein